MGYQLSSEVQLEVIPATLGQQSILANLIELYAHDFSEFQHIELQPDGRFGYEPLPLYWSEPGRHPFLVRIDGNLAGFVLVRAGSEISGDQTVWDMAEFFIVRSYRRRGAGTTVVHQVLARFPGRWEVRVMESNAPALRFWQQAISGFVGQPVAPASVEYHGKVWSLFSFESPHLLPNRHRGSGPGITGPDFQRSGP